MRKKVKPLSYEEKRELVELWQRACERARAQGKTLAPQWILDVGQREALEELRKAGK